MRFEILGPIRAFVGEREVAVTAPRERTLLAMLLVHANRSVSSDQLIDSIWPRTVPQDARNQLQLCVARLRRRFAESGGDRNTIATDHGGYRIAVGSDQLDVEVFRRLVAEGRAARDPEQAEAAYRSALALWHGPALADVDSSTIRHAATVLDDEHIQATEECIEVGLSLGKARELLSELQGLAQRHPFREKLHGAYMLALYRSGRHADALTAYREVRRLLRDELGVEPGHELQDLHKAILKRDPSLEAPQPRPPAAPIPRELPGDVAGFTGRVEALKSLDELLPDGQDPTGPVVISAIAGTAGVGKTALAVHWAHRAAERFPDGQLYINLRGYAPDAPLRPIEALSMLLRSLGLPPDQIPTEEADAAARYRSLLADRRVLIVLDNARSVDQVRPLLPGGRGCLALVTSRDKLAGLVARDGARRITLDVLSPTEAYALLAHVLGAERIRAEPEATAELAEACARLPLALRIAAAMLDERPDRRIEDFAAQLIAGHRLAALAVQGDPETAVRATFDLSYHTIAEPAQRLFRLLGLVPGPDFTQDAAAALADLSPGETKQLLGRLTTAHLVSEHNPSRYAFHDLLREYARDRANKDDSDSARAAATERLLGWYLNTSDTASRLLQPDAARLPQPPDLQEYESSPLEDRGKAMAWLNQERANLVAVVRYTAEHGPRRYAWILADRLRGYNALRADNDGMIIGRAALAAAEAEGNLQDQASAHIALADNFLFRMSEPHHAAEHYRRASALAAQHGWLPGEATAENNLSLANLNEGRLRLAANHLSRALTINQRLGRVAVQASNLGNLGFVSYQLGRLREARDRWEQALEILRSVGDLNHVAVTHGNLGNAHWLLGELKMALDHLHEALRLHRESGNTAAHAQVLRLLAVTLCDMGCHMDALEKANSARSLVQGGGELGEQALSSSALAAVQTSMCRYEDALRNYEFALRLGERHMYAWVDALIGLATIHRHLCDYETALCHASKALGLARKAEYGVLEGRAITELAEIRLRKSDLDRSRELAECALENHRNTGHRLGEARTLAVLGHIARTGGEKSAAHQRWLEARDLFIRVGAPVPVDLL